MVVINDIVIFSFTAFTRQYEVGTLYRYGYETSVLLNEPQPLPVSTTKDVGFRVELIAEVTPVWQHPTNVHEQILQLTVSITEIMWVLFKFLLASILTKIMVCWFCHYPSLARILIFGFNDLINILTKSLICITRNWCQGMLYVTSLCTSLLYTDTILHSSFLTPKICFA